MAVRREVIEHYSDDIDGSKADEAMKFSFDGKSYVIDLSKRNAAAFRKAMAQYVQAARRETGTARRRAKGSSISASGLDMSAVREWAAKEGHSVAARGRLAKSVVDKYLVANSRVTPR